MPRGRPDHRDSNFLLSLLKCIRNLSSKYWCFYRVSPLFSLQDLRPFFDSVTLIFFQCDWKESFYFPSLSSYNTHFTTQNIFTSATNLKPPADFNVVHAKSCHAMLHSLLETFRGHTILQVCHLPM